MSARKDIEHGLSFAEDVRGHVVNAYSAVKGATDDPGDRMEAAVACMEALLHLSCLEDEIRAALSKLPNEGSPHGGENLDNSRHRGEKSGIAQESDDIGGMVRTLSRRPS